VDVVATELFESAKEKRAQLYRLDAGDETELMDFNRIYEQNRC